MNGETTRTEITVGTAAKVLDLPFDTIERMCEEGKLRARRIGERGWWRIDYDSVIDFLSGKKEKSE